MQSLSANQKVKSRQRFNRSAIFPNHYTERRRHSRRKRPQPNT
jgi:hypothetical protein